jgi:hypothetical protein
MRNVVVALLATSLFSCSSGSDTAPATEADERRGGMSADTPTATDPAGSNGTNTVGETGAPSAAMASGTEAIAPDLVLAPGAAGGGATKPEGSGGAAPEGSGGAAPEGSGGAPAEEVFAGMELFILFGQSNMAGSAPIEAQDREENPRVKVLGMYDCPEFGRVHNEWAIASPPLHACFGEVGPADYFAKALAAAWPDSEIGLIPNAVPGVEIDFFRKGLISREDQSYKQLPRDWDSAYDMMVARTRLAMESGRVRGILFHQGESDSGQPAWVGKVAEIVANLKADLGLGDIPFLPGELPPTACCGGHNTLVNQLPAQIPNTVVISAQGLTVHDAYHFDTPSVRIFGQRYADAFLALVPNP